MLHYLTCLASCVFAPLRTHVALVRIAVRTDVVSLPCFAWNVSQKATDEELTSEK